MRWRRLWSPKSCGTLTARKSPRWTSSGQGWTGTMGSAWVSDRRGWGHTGRVIPGQHITTWLVQIYELLATNGLATCLCLKVHAAVLICACSWLIDDVLGFVTSIRGQFSLSSSFFFFFFCLSVIIMCHFCFLAVKIYIVHLCKRLHPVVFFSTS